MMAGDQHPQLKYLVVGATGHVGSKVTVLLADRGHDVTALVRAEGTTVRDGHTGVIKYAVGDLNDEASLRRALRGIDVVVCTANGLLPQRRGDSVVGVNDAAVRLIDLCEEAGVRKFVQSSTPTFERDERIPELRGKRRIEERLAASTTMQSIVVRNPAFMDVFLVMGGCAQAEDRSLHATTKRDFGFTKFWKGLTGNLVSRYGLFLAPGGANHGTPTISTRDVAELLYGGAVYAGSENLLIEAGGPQWLTWRQIADALGAKLGRRRVRIIPMPAWFARLNCQLASPFSASVANIFAMMSFVADFQPTTWTESTAAALKKLNAPAQLTLADYLDQNIPVNADKSQ